MLPITGVVNTRSIRVTAAAAACVLVLTAPSARAVQAQQNPPAGGAIGAPQAPAERLNIVSGRSRPLDMPFDIDTFQVTDPEIADVVVVSAREIIVNGKRPGTISLWIWGGGRRLEYEVVVDPGTTTLQQRFQALYPGEDIQVSPNFSRPMSRNTGDSAANGWTAEHTSCTKPGRVTSADRQPPPGRSATSTTRTDRPARASKTAAVSPFGPLPTTMTSGGESARADTTMRGSFKLHRPNATSGRLRPG